MLQDEEPYIFRWLRKEYGGISKPTFSYRLISDMFFYPIYFRYFLGNGSKFDAKIDKNTNKKQIKAHFF